VLFGMMLELPKYGAHRAIFWRARITS